ncbi:MAG TPA: SAM-dependent methyltransferase [Gammaproteobacteria bacterium]|nr:SAM-dependent methyltransferase [Gammaproteobacteria bacterium]
MSPISQSLEDLPPPPPDALAHSKRVRALIQADIQRAGGRVPFSRFMELALYAPGLGYYSAGARKFGAAGDFVTAPEISPLFSHCLGRQSAELLQALGGGDVLELGAGSGAMAAHLLQEMRRQEREPQNYLILEVSADLRQRQRATIKARAPEFLSRVQWLEALPEAFTGVMLGNEVLDALPVARFRRARSGFQEFNVAMEGEGFRWELADASLALDDTLTDLESMLPEPLAEGYVSEYCPTLAPLVASLAAALTRGAMLFMDYGYTRAAYYHPQRSMGTLMCHYRQRAHGDPFFQVGLQDITAHVDFSAVAAAGTAAGLELAGYSTQTHFLLALGIGEAALNAGPAAVQQVKRLTLPEEMGELFKAIGFTKGIDIDLGGFKLRDLSRTL